MKRNIYEILGAKTFKKLVLKVEEIKFYSLEQYFPNFLKHYENYLDKRMLKQLKHVHSEETKDLIKYKYQLQKLKTKKELVKKESCNYHMDTLKPTLLKEYIKWNKNIHIRGMINDTILLLILTVLAFNTKNSIITILLIIETFSLFIDFQCVNLQNYHLERIKKTEKILTKLEEKRKKDFNSNYKNISNKINELRKEKEKNPTTLEILENIKTNKEELLEFKKLLLEQKEITLKNKTKRKGDKMNLTTLLSSIYTTITSYAPKDFDKNNLITTLTITSSLSGNNNIELRDIEYTSAYVESLKEDEIEKTLNKLELYLEEETNKTVEQVENYIEDINQKVKTMK